MAILQHIARAWTGTVGKCRLLSVTLLNVLKRTAHTEDHMLILGKMMAMQIKDRASLNALADAEFRVFSQFGDDGILQWLTHHLNLEARTFVEFGVEDYRESTTRFLMMNDNWSGLIMDGSLRKIRRVRLSEYFWQYDLQAEAVFVDRDNINGLLAKYVGEELDILHIDVDGNDYWVWQAITGVRPALVIMEYNSVFGGERAITVPYDKAFVRSRAHSSNLYFGASLAALRHLANEKEYAFIGCNSAGNNAYFVRDDRLTEPVRELVGTAAYVTSKCRESRDSRGRLTFLSGAERLNALAGMPVHNVVTGQLETV